MIYSIDINIHLVAPRKGLFKLKTDKAAKGNKGIGGIIRNQKGDCALVIMKAAQTNHIYAKFGVYTMA